MKLFLVYSGCRMGFYEYLRDHVMKKNESGYFPVWYVVPVVVYQDIFIQ